MLYEAMLLFAVLFISNWLFSTLLQQRHALYLRHVLQIWLFLILAAYFIWFWTHGGQTLAMKTWRIRMVSMDGAPVQAMRAVGRYFLGWLWVLPGMALAWMLDVKNGLLLLLPLANILLLALTAYFDPHRQFLHDRVAGTRVVTEDKAD